MAGGSGWMPLQEPPRRGREAFDVSPFARLARVHAASAAGDVIVAVALAGSLFFSIDPTQARWRVGLYLLLTLAPFAVVAPLIGPAIDRFHGGSRWVIVLTGAARTFVAFLMIRHLDGLLLFPEAFAMLVMTKGYAVAKTAYVPATVRSDTDLVKANSRLALIAALAGPVAAVPAGLVHVLLGSHWVVGLSMVPFGLATGLALRLPAAPSWSLAGEGAAPVDAGSAAAPTAPGPTAPGAAATGPSPGVVDATQPGARDDAVVQPPNGPAGAPVGARPGPGSASPGEHGLWLAASTMGLLRGVVGFLTFLLAFALRSGGESVAGYGLVLAGAGAGNLIGSFVAPQLRRMLREDQILVAALGCTAVVGVVGALTGGLGAAVLVVVAVGVAGAAAKLAFDSLVQRDAPAGDKGRLLAQFEARFQLLWVVGAFIPVVVPLPARLGYLLLGLLAAAASASYLLGRQTLGATVSQLTRRHTEPAGRPADASPSSPEPPPATSWPTVGGTGTSTPTRPGPGPVGGQPPPSRSAAGPVARPPTGSWPPGPPLLGADGGDGRGGR